MITVKINNKDIAKLSLNSTYLQKLNNFFLDSTDLPYVVKYSLKPNSNLLLTIVHKKTKDKIITSIKNDIVTFKRGKIDEGIIKYLAQLFYIISKAKTSLWKITKTPLKYDLSTPEGKLLKAIFQDDIEYDYIYQLRDRTA